jgi:hypothetical protein
MICTIQPVLSFRSTASAVLDAEANVMMLELPELSEVFVEILFTWRFVATVMVAAAFVTVAMRAVPLDDTAMII